MKTTAITDLLTFGRDASFRSWLFAPQLMAGTLLFCAVSLAMAETSVTYNAALTLTVSDDEPPPQPPPMDPGDPTSDSPQCDDVGVTLTRSGVPPSGVTWYWQTSASGTNTANSGSTIRVFVSGTYYIRARDNNTLLWSSGAGSVTATVTDCTLVFTCGNVYTDTRDNNSYATVLIGSQCWMAENLKYLPSVAGPDAGSQTTPYYYVYDYDGTSVIAAKATSNYQNYGVLYNWTAAMAGAPPSSANPSGVQGVCPAGWNIPSDDEWVQLINYVVSQGYPNDWDSVNGAGNALKSARRDPDAHPRWDSHATHFGIDVFGFSAFPGGNLSFKNFDQLGLHGTWWSSTITSSDAWSYRIWHNFGRVGRQNISQAFGLSLRCVRDPYPEGETPENRNVMQKTIEPGESVCFDALQTINVADFSVYAEGSAIFVAGQNIIFGPGTVVENGGYLHAYITTTASYCAPTKAEEISDEFLAEEVIISVEELSSAREKGFIKIYPNPTAGSFTLELDDQSDQEMVYVQVYSILGNRLISKHLPSEQPHSLSLDGQQPGIYIIRVMRGGRIGVEMLIKR